MATNQELNEQLALTIKLTQAVEAMARAAAQAEKSFEQQADTLEKIVRSARQARKTDKGGIFGEHAFDSTQMNSYEKNVRKVSRTVVSEFKSVGDTLSKKFPRAIGVASGALFGVVQGFKNVIALSKSVGGFFASLASGAFELGAAIVSIPFKMFSALVDTAAKAELGLTELLQAIEKVREAFGDLKGPGAGAVMTTSYTLKGFSASGLSAWRVFGNLAERIEKVNAVAQAMGPTFSVLTKEFEDHGGALLGFQKGLGASDEQMKSIAQRAIAIGKPMSRVFIDMTKQTLALGKAFDLDQKLIGKDMAKALQDVAHFGALTVKQIGQASVYARKLGLDLDKITGTLDAFETFDTAAENAAKLTQTFGVQVDAFKLMEAQNPAEQLDTLRKAFRGAGIDAAGFTRQQAKLLSQTTGLDEATVRQAFSMKNQGASLDQIKKKSETAEKKTLSQAEAMSKLADSMERLVKQYQGQTGSFWDMFVKGVFRGLNSSKEFIGIIYNIKFALHQVHMIGVQLGRVLPKIFPGLGDFLQGIREFFDPKKFKDLFKGISDLVKKFLDPKGGLDLEGFMEQLRAKFFDFFDASKPAGQKILSGFKNMLRFIAKVVAEAIPLIAKKLGEGLQFFADLISGKVSLSGLVATGKGGLGFLGELFGPIVTALKTAWNDPKFRDGLENFLTAMGERLTKIVESPTFRKVAKGFMAAVLGVFLGPTLVHGILGGLVTKMLPALVSGAGGIMKNVVPTVLKKAGLAVAGAEGKGLVATNLAKTLGMGTGIGAFVLAAASIGKGVKEYTGLITAEVDRSSKTIAAGATGLFDALTLGLLPKDWLVEIANVFAEMVDGIYIAIGNVFGVGFANSMKDQLASTFELFGGIYSVIAELFTGDQASFDKAVDEFGMTLLRFVVNAVQYVFVQLPNLMSRMINVIMSSLTNIIIKLLVFSFQGITKAVDDVFGTDLTEKMKEVSQKAQKYISESTEKTNALLRKDSEKISDATREFTDEYLRSASEQSGLTEAAARGMAKNQANAAASANASVERSLSQTLHDVRSARELSTELSSLGEEGISLSDLMSELQDQLGGGDFESFSITGFSEEQMKAINSVTVAFGNVQTLMSAMIALEANSKKIAKIVKSDGLKPVMEAISEMVKLANQLESALGDGNLNKLDVKAKLGKVASSLGLGAKGRYEVKNKDVNINVNFTVVMNAADLEKALVVRANSFVRQRLDALVAQVAGSPPIAGGMPILAGATYVQGPSGVPEFTAKP